MKLRAIILGCGSSGGVPRIGGEDGRGNWGDCDPSDPRNRRSRCSVVIQRANERGTFEGELTTLLIDTSPDMRTQLIDNAIPHVDAVAITHDHADQTHGIDDLRVVAINRMKRVPVYLSDRTAPILPERFRYAFEQLEGSGYPPVLERLPLPEDGETVTIDGPSGSIPLTPFLQHHGEVPSHGFCCGPIAYSADLNDLYPESWSVVEGADVWIIDALQYRPHVSHLHLVKALEFLDRARVRRGVLTNLHVVMNYETVAAETPEHVTPAHDGLIIEAKG
jgi:phosphoribosyl 1,2-cyclic phosphate phosphodiesterase